MTNFKFKKAKNKLIEFTKWIPFLGLIVYGGYLSYTRSYYWITGEWLCYHLFVTNVITIIISVIF